MKLPQDSRERRDAVIAACVTFAVALVLLVLLFVLTVGTPDVSRLAEESIPEIQDVEEEEIFLEPEMLVLDRIGFEDGDKTLEEMPQPLGEPEISDEVQNERVIKNDKIVEQPSEENPPPLLSDDKSNKNLDRTTPMPADTTKNITDHERPNIQFPQNGKLEGEITFASGTGEKNPKGNKDGRHLEHWPPMKYTLSQPAQVTINIEVNAEGKVTYAKAAKNSGGDKKLQQQCEKWALETTWTPKKGAPITPGVLRFNIPITK